MNKYIKKYCLISKIKDGRYQCSFRKGWGMVWEELNCYIDSYRDGKLRGGTTWFVEIENTKKLVTEKFYKKIKGRFLIKEVSRKGKIKNLVEYID